MAMEDGEHNFVYYVAPEAITKLLEAANNGENSIKKKLRTFLVPIHIVINSSTVFLVRCKGLSEANKDI